MLTIGKEFSAGFSHMREYRRLEQFIVKEFCMKNFTKLFGIIDIMAIIVFSMTACKEEEKDGPLAGTRWVAKVTNSTNRATNTYTFSDSSKGNYSISGQYLDYFTNRWTDYPTTGNFSFTYEFSEEKQAGAIYANDGNKRGFTISGNTMTIARANNAGTDIGVGTYTRE
jgi:hypothetical protein